MLVASALKFKYRQSDWSDACAHQLLFWVVQLKCRLVQGESFHSLIEEEIYSFIVKSKDQRFQEVDEVVSKLFILTKVKVKWD